LTSLLPVKEETTFRRGTPEEKGARFFFLLPSLFPPRRRGVLLPGCTRLLLDGNSPSRWKLRLPLAEIPLLWFSPSFFEASPRTALRLASRFGFSLGYNSPRSPFFSLNRRSFRVLFLFPRETRPFLFREGEALLVCFSSFFLRDRSFLRG